MRTFPRILWAALLLVISTAPAFARDWAAVSLRGTVLSLAGSEWSEVENGAVLSGYNALRTLQSGRLELASAQASIYVGPNTAFELFTNAQSTTTLVRQYSGTLTVRAGNAAGGTLRLETAAVHVVPSGGAVTIAITGATTEVSVEAGGKAAVTDAATGRIVTVASGEAASSGPRGLEIAAGRRGGDRSGGIAGEGGAEAANGDADGTGNGNEGGNGNGGGNGNAGDNGNPGNGDNGNPGNGGNGNPGNGGGNVGGAGNGGGGNAGNGGGNPGAGGNPGGGNAGGGNGNGNGGGNGNAGG